MTLSAHLIEQMNGFATPTGRQYPAPTVGADGSQWGSHHGWSPGYVPPPTPGRFTPWSEEKIATLQVRLARKLGPEYITQRPGPGGGPKLNYLEGWKAVNLANEVFGFNGWSSSIIKLQTDFLDVNAQDRCCVGITAIIRITLQDGCFHEDIGYGHAENVRGKATALEKAQKEAVTDGIKRALKHFGNVLGNCLYDRDYTKEVQKIKVGPAKFNIEELERRAEFTPQGASRASAVPRHVSGNSKPPPPPPPPIIEPDPRDLQDTPLRSIEDEPLGVDDSEFAFLESESFLGDLDESVLGARVSDPRMLIDAKPERLHAPQAGPSHQPAQPAYQHRQRPDTDDSARALNTSTSSNGSDSEAQKARRVGGFAMPAGPSGMGESAAAAAAARRAAIMGLSRAESPRIPSGGIDAVAARASANLQSHGANLEIENQVDTPGRYSAFTSARGVKRDGSASPTKSDRLRPSGPRSALSELPDWQAKRSRIE